jgi:hypothetical protein
MRYRGATPHVSAREAIPRRVLEVENVVDQTERYWVVDKIGTAGELAADRDPRNPAFVTVYRSPRTS